MKLLTKYTIATLLFLGFASCDAPLEEEVFSQLAPGTLFTTEGGISTVLNSAYSNAHHNVVPQASWAPWYTGGTPTEEIWGAGGSIEALWVQLRDFTWDGNHSQLDALWTTHYYAIRDANVVLDNIDNPEFSSSFVATTTAEARFIRGWCYSELYKLFGNVPIYSSSQDDPLQPNSTESELQALIEGELTQAISGLPVDTEFGRGSKGAARGVLLMYYMNTRQWQKAADLANDIINSGNYSLQTNYSDVFAIANEGNSEMLWAMTKNPQGAASAAQALTYPPNFPRPYPNNGVFAARTYLFDSFVNSFEAGDTRADMIITQWVDNAGNAQQGLGKNQSFPAKYEFDPNSSGWQAGNDFPVVRYADVLLSRAEALNEISGPSQEVINLVNQVRERAKATPLSLADFSSKEGLRDAILKERRWEFFHEGKSREVLLRHGLFISDAVARGKNAKDYHVLYPIPQVELDANSLLQQNSGY